MNNSVKVKVGSPLLRPGLTLETEVSAKYVKLAATEMVEFAREINSDPYFDEFSGNEETDCG